MQLTDADRKKAASAERSLPPQHRPCRVAGRARDLTAGHPVYYTDGSVSTRRFANGLGVLTGWGYLGTDGTYGCGREPQFVTKAGRDISTVTELRAVWHAVGDALTDGQGPLTVVLDSMNAVDLLSRWKAGGDRMPAGYVGRTKGEPTLVRLRLAAAANADRLTVQHVHGHAGDTLNEAADVLAQLGMRWARDGLPDDQVARRAASVATGFIDTWLSL